MDLTTITTALGLATSAISATGQAATTADAIKKLFTSDKKAENKEAQDLLNTLAAQLTAANMMNVQLSEAIKSISQELRRQDDFENEKARYELFQTGQNDIVFKLKEDRANGQPIHFICPVCLNSDRQFSYIRGEGDYKICQKNNTHALMFKNTPTPHLVRRSNWMD